MKLKHCIMNKYKLINKATGEEHICEKVVIDGWDYYVSDETVGNYCWYINTYTNKLYHSSTLKPNENSKKVIATNNPSIDIPKVVDEVEILVNKLDTPENLDQFSFDKGFIDGYNNSQKTHPFSEEDMKSFGKFCIKNNVCKEENRYYQYWELLQLWKEQRLKTLYYE